MGQDGDSEPTSVDYFPPEVYSGDAVVSQLCSCLSLMSLFIFYFIGEDPKIFSPDMVPGPPLRKDQIRPSLDINFRKFDFFWGGVGNLCIFDRSNYVCNLYNRITGSFRIWQVKNHRIRILTSALFPSLSFFLYISPWRSIKGTPGLVNFVLS